MLVVKVKKSKKISTRVEIEPILIRKRFSNSLEN
jgi:NADH/NAD ratio-sensing transcriptional regulator Rex